MGKRIEVSAVESIVGTGYPAPYDEPCRSRDRKRLGNEAGLTQFGANLSRFPPGAWSSQRHWHSNADELIYIIEGEVVLVTDDGEEILRAGDTAEFKAGDPNGHHLQNRSESDVLVIEIGTRNPENAVTYPDIDMVAPARGKPARLTRRDGTLFPGNGHS